MEKAKAAGDISESLKRLDLNPGFNSEATYSISASTLQSFRITCDKTKPPSLVSLCLGVVGRHLEDIIADLAEIAISFPASIKMAIAAISRRRKLLSDDVIVALADSSWEILDISGSDISDSGLVKVAEICRSLRAVDISRCNKITAVGVSELLQRCKYLHTLRWGIEPKLMLQRVPKE